MTRALKIVVGVVVAAAVLVVGGTWLYINVIKEDPPERFSLDADEGDGSTTTTGAGAAENGDVTGTWQVAEGSQAGYRIKEILFGQDAEAVGRTTEVTGRFVIDGTSVTAAELTVDMASVTSDQERRDNQFRGRIMDVATFPTATFVLSEPIDLGDAPADGTPVEVTATGELTLRGTTKAVEIALQAERRAGQVRVAGSLDVVFGEWGIPDPSFGPAQVGEEGTLEFLLLFSRS